MGIAVASSVEVAAENWIAGSGNWSTSGNWNPATVPTSGDTVTITPGDGAARTITYDYAGPDISLGALSIDLTGAGVNRTTFSMAGHNLTTIGFLLGSTGRATWDQSGGLVMTDNPSLDSVLGQFATGNAIYNLSGTGALVIARDLYVGSLGTGVFNHSGGVVNVAATLRLGTGAGSSGTYTLSNNASFAIANAIIGGSGTGTMTVGTGAMAFIGTDLSINSASSVNINGGTLRFNTVSGTGSFLRINFNSGTLQLAGTRSIGTDPTIGGLFGFSNPIIAGPRKLAIEGNARINTELLLAGGKLTSNSVLEVGFNSPGIVDVFGGGVVERVSAVVGGPGSSNGAVIVSDAGSMWKTSAEAIVGGFNQGVVNINPGGTVFVGTTLNVGSLGEGIINLVGGTLRFNSYIQGSNGTFNYGSGTIQVAGDRTLGTDPTIAQFFGSSLVVPTGKGLTVEGTATIPASLPLSLSGGTLSAGTLVLLPASRLFTTQASQQVGPVVALAGSMIDATGGNLALGDATKVNGFYGNGTLQVGQRTVTLNDANDAVFDSAALVTLGDASNAGSLSAANGLTLDFGGNITGFGAASTPNLLAKPLINNGHITGTSAAQRITLPGYVKGVGTFDNVNFTGTFSPGLSPTILSVGNVALSATSTIVLEIGGATAGGGYDQIQSSGALAFDGTLQVSLIGGFTPVAGQSFNLFDWASLSGTFDVLQLPALAGLAWDTSELYTDGVLSVVAPGVDGDYNDDGAVNAADYVLWRKLNGTSAVMPNDPNPLPIDGDQYLTWRGNFGQASSGSGSVTNGPVPEPAILVLIAMAVAGHFVGRRTSYQMRKLVGV
jgi:T5SS/PEP-CTERM-associated repeat protein